MANQKSSARDTSTEEAGNSNGQAVAVQDNAAPLVQDADGGDGNGQAAVAQDNATSLGGRWSWLQSEVQCKVRRTSASEGSCPSSRTMLLLWGSRSLRLQSEVECKER